MSAWIHNDYASKETITDLGLEFFNAKTPICKYCRSKMLSKKIQDHWKFAPNEYIQAHQSGLDFQWPVKEQGVSLNDLGLKNDNPRDDIYCTALTCEICGWWVLEKRVFLSSKSKQIWESAFATCGRLKNLDLDDVTIPIEDVRTYIAAKYKDRFAVHPRTYEEIVSSVFKDLGYESIATAYSNDGGIDVILTDSKNNQIGVQVKRSKNRIKVDQIRAFLGALIINNYTKGVFVTTSTFQKGSKHLASQCSLRDRQIELIDADKFLNALGVAQARKFNQYNDYPFDTLDQIPRVHFVSVTHLNSL